MNISNNRVIDIMHTRRSIAKLDLPMPTEEELNTALTAAMTAPDHKRLRPWRFIVLRDDALVDFGQVLLRAEQATTDGSLSDAACQKLLNMPLRAPMIITLIAQIKEHEKVPSFEQLLSMGAAAQNLLLSLESMGYRTVWRTGKLCNAPEVKAYFRTADQDIICGFVYVGSSNIQMPCRDVLDLSEFVEYRY